MEKVRIGSICCTEKDKFKSNSSFPELQRLLSAHNGNKISKLFWFKENKEASNYGQLILKYAFGALQISPQLSMYVTEQLTRMAQTTVGPHWK